jgi:hypothetical protein
MKDNFTEQQREIVARKMGFDGPMQNFGEFLMSSPSTATQYSAVASKLGEKAQGFAVGGMPQQAPVKKGATTIFTEYMASKGIEDPKSTLDDIEKNLKDKKAILIKDKNTVVVLDLRSPKAVSALLATTDIGATLDASMALIIKQIKSLNIKKMYGVEENEEFKQACASNGFQVVDSDLPEFEWCAVVK